MPKTFNFREGELLLVDKPLEWTSFDVVNKIRYAVSKYEGKRMKVGHAGTLDPLATGLLIIATGKKTKQLQEYMGQVKEYTGAFRLGQTTPSYDAETEVDQEFDLGHVDEHLILDTTQKFLGTIEQLPPLYSAVKVEGERLYKKARKGQEVEIKPRQITIEEFEITQIEMPTVKFRVKCSKGTYIRSLAYDFGKAVAAGAYLSELRRTQIGEFRVENAHALDQLVAQIRSEIAENS